MKRPIFLAAVLGSLVTLIPWASAQEKNKLTGLIGRTFLSDQGVTGTSTPGALLTSGHGLSFEGNYARRLMDFGIVGSAAKIFTPKVAKEAARTQRKLGEPVPLPAGPSSPTAS